LATLPSILFCHKAQGTKVNIALVNVDGIFTNYFDLNFVKASYPVRRQYTEHNDIQHNDSQHRACM
jgi:hypothetical protein